MSVAQNPLSSDLIWAVTRTFVLREYVHVGKEEEMKHEGEIMAI